MKTYYYILKTLRVTKNGKRFVKYHYFEDFGRERSEAYSWGCREKRGNNFIWLNFNEDIYEAIKRRNEQYY